MRKANIGVVCLARTTFDYRAALEIYNEKIDELKKNTSVEWHFIDGLVIEPAEAEKAGRTLAGACLDGVVIISGTFHLGHLALIIDKYLHLPALLWAFPELEYNGGKIRLNSVCGVNLNASNFYKSGKDDYCCCVSGEIDSAWLGAVKMLAAVRNAHLGIAGYRADGFFNLSVSDTDFFSETGVLIDHYELSELMSGGEGCGVSVKDMKTIYDCRSLTETQVDKVSALSCSMEAFLDANSLDALAVRCWPEFARDYGVSPCAAMSLLAGKGRIIGCEGDVEGTLSMLALNAVVSESPFLADLSQVNLEEDYALMWHCGVAAYPLWDGKSVRSLDTYFAGGKGVTAGFVMKSGTVTVMRIDTARGKTRVFVEKGEAVPMEKLLTGTYCKVKFDKNIKDILDTVTSTGIAHHVALVYGDFTDEIKTFARLKGFEIIS